jgi:phosphoglycolate phosphatase-like HAD superfamily hydrolase
MWFVIDIDGTLSDHNHRFHHINTPDKKKDWKAYFEAMGDDPPIPAAVTGLQLLRRSFPNESLFFLTGRPEEYRALTVGWLKKFFNLNTYEPQKAGDSIWHPKYPVLFMRPTGDHRSSVEYKEGILKTLPTPLIFLDDDLRNVEMYRRYGLYLKAPECWNVLL